MFVLPHQLNSKTNWEIYFPKDRASLATNYQIIKPTGAKLIGFIAKGGSGGGAGGTGGAAGTARTGGGGGGSGALTVGTFVADLFPDQFFIAPGWGGTAGVGGSSAAGTAGGAGSVSVVYYRYHISSNSVRIVLANGASGGSGGSGGSSGSAVGISDAWGSMLGGRGAHAGSTGGSGAVGNVAPSNGTFLNNGVNPFSSGAGGAGLDASNVTHANGGGDIVIGTNTSGTNYALVGAASGGATAGPYDGVDGIFVMEPILYGTGGTGGAANSSGTGGNGGNGGIGSGGGGGGGGTSVGGNGGKGGDGFIIMWWV